MKKIKVLLSKALLWFKVFVPKLTDAVDVGKEFANQVKEIADNPLLEAVVKSTSTKIDDGALAVIKIAVTGVINILGWKDIILSDIKDVTAKAVILTTVSSQAQIAYQQYKGEANPSNIQQSLIASVLAYDESKVLDS